MSTGSDKATIEECLARADEADAKIARLPPSLPHARGLSACSACPRVARMVQATRASRRMLLFSPDSVLGVRLHATVEEITTLIATSKPAAVSGGGKELQEYQKGMLDKLRSLRDSLETERAPFTKMQAERNEAVAANIQVLLVYD